MADRRSRPGVPSAPARFLFATGISMYGDWLTTVALVVVLYRLTGSTVATAGYFMVRTVPRIVGPTIGGRLADRSSPTRVIAASSAAQAVTAAGLLLAVGARSLTGIYLCVLAAQLFGSAARPCFAAAIPQLADESRWDRLNAGYGGLQSSSMLLAPALGAVVLGAAGYIPLLVADLISFAGAGIIMATLPTSRPPARASRERTSTRELWMTVLRVPVLRSLAAANFGNFAVVTALQAVLVAAAAERFGGDANVGLLYAAVGGGGLAGSALMLRAQARKPGVVGIALAVLVELLPIALLTAAPNLWSAWTLLFVSSIGGAVYPIRGTSALQRAVAPSGLARANGVLWAVGYVGMLIGALSALVLGQLAGWRLTVLAVSAGSLVVLCLAVLPRGSVGSAATIADPTSSSSAG